MIAFTLNGELVEATDVDASLLCTLRDELGIRSAKDGCSPQGQCGCCTVLVDGQPRVACVTPTRRVAGREITTIEGFDPSERDRWAASFCATGASQCGFCTPGIIVRLAGLEVKKPDASDTDVGKALAAHLCRCTGWQTIVEAWHHRNADHSTSRDLAAATQRATIESRTPQIVSGDVALGQAGFADDRAPTDALVAVRADAGDWVVANSVDEARRLAGKVQGRRTTLEPRWPIEIPAGDWAATLQTTWVEPAYLETDATWALPSGEAATTLANGGAFGAKIDNSLAAVAQSLADEYQQAVRVLYSREDTVRFGPKRPPIAGGANTDGAGVIRVAATDGIEAAIARIAPDLVVEQVETGAPLQTSAQIRAAGWAEAHALLSLARGEAGRATGPEGGWAEATVTDGQIDVLVDAGAPLDETVLRSFCIGAAHMAWSWVTSEALAVDDDGEPRDLTIRSFGVVRALETPTINVSFVGDGKPVNASDAVFVAVAAAAAVHLGAMRWPSDS